MAGARPWIAATVFYAAAAGVLLWPLVAHLGSVVVEPGSDPLLTVWILWWNTHAVPFSDGWWNAPIFYPTTGTLAFSELLVGLTPITAPIQWLTHNPVAAHNAAVVLSFPLCAIAAHALAFEITRRHDASTLAGLAFGFAAIRGNEIAHIQMLAFYWTPVALLALHRFVQQPRAGWLALFGLACLAQLLSNGYTIFQLPVLVALWTLWFARRTRDALAIGAVLGGVLAAITPILLKYREIHDTLQLQRSIDEIVRFSASIESFVSAPASNVALGSVLTAKQSYALFPGLTVVLCLCVALVMHLRDRARVPAAMSADRIVLAAVAGLAASAAASVWIAGPWAVGPLTVSTPHKPLAVAILCATVFLLRGPRFRAVWRARTAVGFYAIAAVVFVVLSLGPEPRIFGVPFFYKAPYAWLMSLPGYASIRAPDRFAMMAVLCVAVLVAATFPRWSSRLPRRANVIWTALCLGLLLDGWFRVDVAAVPPRPDRVDWQNAVAVVEVPLDEGTNAAATYRSIWYGLPVVNGVSGYVPPQFPALEAAVADVDAGVLIEFATRGPIGVVVHRSSPAHDRWVAAVSALPGVVRLGDTAASTHFLIPEVSRPARSERSESKGVPIVSVETNVHPENARHLTDGRLDRVWATAAQQGTEELIVTLDRAVDVGAVVIQLGACPFGFPRELVAEVATDDVWSEVFRGPTAVLAARAALADPRAVPLTIPIGARAQRLRLRQARVDATPLCIAELAVHAK